jgi:Kip1 ubiquitination-promoting complex protein 2
MRSERVLQAFQSMIEDPSSAHDYMNDPEVGPILLRVHSILARVADGHGSDDAPARSG